MESYKYNIKKTMEAHKIKESLNKINELKTILGIINPIDSIWKIGKQYLIRTVTMTIAGTLIKVTDKELLMSNAAWIADTGKFHNALKTGVFEEVEPFINDVIVGRGAIIDASIVKFDKLIEK